MPYYAVSRGRTIGIFRAWYKAKQQVDRFSGNEHMKFDTIKEAREYLKGCGFFVPEVKKGRPRKGELTRDFGEGLRGLRRAYRGEGDIKEPIYDPESGDVGTRATGL